MARLFKKIRISWLLVVLCLFYGYLGYHTLSGEQGVLNWADYSNDISVTKSEIETLKAQRDALKIRAGMLSAEHLDLDLLDEQARRELNVSRANEIIIWLDEAP
jgi:cell division protein FtsB